MNEEKNEFKRAYKETELKWKTSNIKYKKDKIRKYLEEIKITSEEQREYVNNQLLIIDELEQEDLIEYLEKINTIIMADNKKVIENIK
ncbi:hypothetical protein [Clostridium sp.]|uniref:hypothetical protein n=1 Tax=Clostridium sp. TaxID=1506 RepID=UPI0026287E99|nr:hypothetical protein [uncultured Clostridium sp.]